MKVSRDDDNHQIGDKSGSRMQSKSNKNLRTMTITNKTERKDSLTRQSRDPNHNLMSSG